MDILTKYFALIAGSIDGLKEATLLKDEGILNSMVYHVLAEMDDSYSQSCELLEIMKTQNNVKAVARLFQIIHHDYKDLAGMIPELSTGVRFSQYLCDQAELSVMVHNGTVVVGLSRIPVSNFYIHNKVYIYFTRLKRYNNFKNNKYNNNNNNMFL